MPDGDSKVRPLRAGDDAVGELVAAAGLHGAYVQNALAGGDGDGVVFEVDGVARGLAWFGPRGNLVLLGEGLGADAEGISTSVVVEHLLRSRWAWRIAMGPAAIVDALRLALRREVLVHRDQVYYRGDRGTANAALVRDDVRAPHRRDRERLARATLALNASDLNIAPARVDRRWLYDMIDERIADGTTRVLGDRGQLTCKLDFGSDGPGGRVLEGVFTFAESRGRGLAAALVASCLAGAPGRVLLHVGAHNLPARRAYERAGMTPEGTCRLLLLG
ncbi:MAG: GNAT family N-acetyltransferase [Planctomycetes bacterium]|nr:GNAT family N-acetyltransferase [Planctomycetota bacterium]